MSHFAFRILLNLAIAVPVLAPLPRPAHAADAVTLVLGRITDEPQKHFPKLRAMADELARELAPDGVARVDVAMVETLDKMKELLAAGKVDIVSETPFMALDLEAAGVARLLLREWKSGVAEYSSIIIARADGPVKRIEDIAGRRFAFEDPGSTSGYLIPRDVLETANLNLFEMRSPRDPVPDGRVGYSFANGEINVVAWVSRGLADAGAISNLDWDDPSAMPAHLKSDIVAIHRTPPVVRSIVMVRAGLDVALAARLSDVLEHMHETPAGRATLKAYFGVARYDRLDGPAVTGLEATRAIWLRAHGRAG